MKGNMFKGFLAALALTVVVGCGGQNTVPPPAPIPPSNNGGFGGGGGGGGCGGVQGVNSYFSALQVIYNGLTGGGMQQQGGLPSSLSLTVAPQGGQIGFGQQVPATASGCFNWAELNLLYGPTFPGQPAQNRQTAVQLNSQGGAPLYIDTNGGFRDMVLNGTAPIPTGIAVSQAQVVVHIPGGQIVNYQNRGYIMAQQIFVYLNGNLQQPAAVYGTY